MRSASILFLLLMIHSAASNGETYKYTDDKGIICFTDDIKDLPKKYRENAVAIKEDDGRVTVAPPPQADKIDESLLPPKKEAVIKADEVSIGSEGEYQQAFPYGNVAVISSIFLATLVPAFFFNGRTVKRVFGAASLAAMLTLLVYISVFFASRHIQTLKKDALEMTESMKKKEAEKAKEIQDILQEPAKL